MVVELQVVDIAAAAVAAIEAKAGLQCRLVTGGGSGTYKLEAGSGVFNEVQPGEAFRRLPHCGPARNCVVVPFNKHQACLVL